MCQQTSARPLTDLSEPRKVALGDSQERPGAPSGPPSDTPKSSPEPPSREHANGCRESTNSGRPARAPGTGGTLQLQGMIDYVLTRVGGLTRLRPLPPTPKEDLAVSNMRMARSDFSYEYLDEEINLSLIHI